MEKEYRIKKNQEIEKIIQGKKSIGNRNYIIYVRQINETNHFRLGVSVSKKIGNAVVRNHEKRRIRQVFNEIKNDILPFDIFVIAKKDSLELTFLEMKEQVIILLSKINVLFKEEK